VRERLDTLNERLAGHVENLVLFDVADSTHALARKIIAEMDDESQKLGATLILADRQEKGEGRGGRSWESPGGGLYMNWLRSGVTAETIARLPILAAVAAHRALSRIGVSNARIKWPNDILVDGSKIAGILVFASHGETSWVTVGLGVNLGTAPVIDNGAALQPTAVADHVETGTPEEWREDIVCEFINQLDRLMNDPKPAFERWRALLTQRPGDTVEIRLASGETVAGLLVDLTDDGFLKILCDGTERVITGGDIIES
jgi:BirA family biotin operon repressor/biotin-[acetyl-CoA-carboxylase] ligase